jgi:hypothetical protein
MKTTRKEALNHIDGYVHAGQLVYWADETCRWYVGDESDLDDLIDLLDSDDDEISGSAYSHWCAGCTHAEFRREEEARADAEGVRLDYYVQTDSGSETITAPTLEAAYAEARAEITDAMIDDGATLWVESPSGERLTMGVDAE